MSREQSRITGDAAGEAGCPWASNSFMGMEKPAREHHPHKIEVCRRCVLNCSIVSKR